MTVRPQPTRATQVVILAAGIGSRLGRTKPKPLTELDDGRTILSQQFDNIRSVFGATARVTIVVGFKLEFIMEAQPDAIFVYNESFDQTNTSRSLLKALRASSDGGVVWMNGDVVFDPAVLDRLGEYLERDRSAIAVNTSKVAEEEVKYTVDERGFVRGLSKSVVRGLGESVGINFIAARDKDALVRRLGECDAQDYFERGIELAIEHDGIEVRPVDISDLFAVEVDFQEDLDCANAPR